MLPIFTNRSTRRFIGVLAFVIIAMVLVAAVNRRKLSEAGNLTVTVLPLKTGENLITADDVKNSLRESIGSEVDGQMLKVIDMQRIEAALESDPFIEQAECFVDANSTLHVKVMQRAPVLRIIDKNGQGYYLDGFGKKVPLSKNYTSRMLVANGNIPTYQGDSLSHPQNALLRALFELATIIKKDDFLLALTEQINVSPKFDILLIPKVGKQTIILGDPANLKDKLEKVKLFYQEAMPYKGWQAYSTINVKYNGQIVCKK